MITEHCIPQKYKHFDTEYIESSTNILNLGNLYNC